MSEGRGDGSRVHASPHATLLTFCHSLPFAAPTVPQSFQTQHHPIRHLGQAPPPPHTDFRSSKICCFFFSFTLLHFFLLLFFLFVTEAAEAGLQGSARLFVGPPVPRSVPLLLFQQSQYLAWICSCLLVVYKFSCRRTTEIFFFFFSFLPSQKYQLCKRSQVTAAAGKACVTRFSLTPALLNAA